MVLSETVVTTTELFVVLAVGRLIIYLAQKAPYIPKIPFWKSFFMELWTCDLCLGLYCYTLLSLVFGKVLFLDTLGYIPILSELITGSALSMVMFLIRNGWDARFRTIYMED